MFGNTNSSSDNSSAIVKMGPDEIILVDDWDYLTNAVELYDEYINNNKTAFKNFLLWVILRDRSAELPKKFRDARQDFDKV